MSPHLSVYKWSIPMTMSAMNRIFAFALTFGFLAIPLLDVVTGDAVAAIAQFGASCRETQETIMKHYDVISCLMT